MDMVIVTDTKRLVEFTKRLWNKYYSDPSKWIELSPGTYYTQPYIELSDEEYEEATQEIPFLSRRCFMGYMEPGITAITHVDNHDHDPPHIANFNILLEADGDNHFTAYYDHADGPWDAKEKGWVCPDKSKLTETFRYTLPLETPTWFRVDKLHDITNNGKSRRKGVMWVVEVGWDEERFKKWCDDNGVHYEVKYTI